MPAVEFLRSGHTAALAVTAGLAYYLGALVGLGLRFPPSTPSVLWPPNALLTALLLFVPPRRWWAILLGAGAVHFAVELQLWGLPVVAALFVTNSGEALLAASAIRYLNDQPTRMDTFRRMSIFVVAAGLFAPFVSSFLDAGAVWWWNGEDYWNVWRLRFPSNVLAQLGVVPAVAGLLNRRPAIGLMPNRLVHGAAIAGGLILVAVIASLEGSSSGILRTPLVIFFPFLLWAAVRFGPAGVGISVLAVVILAVESQTYSAGLFRQMAPDDQVRILQTFLIVAAVPLLGVAALLEERQAAIAALRASHQLKSSILESIPSLVAVVNRDGRIIAANQSWLSHAWGEVSRLTAPAGAVGSYLDLWSASSNAAGAHVDALRVGIRRVLDGSTPAFNLEYAEGGQDRDVWWAMSAVPLKSMEGGAVVTYTDVTLRKLAELDAQRSRDELAHASRVWVMGELTASLSHQLNQPLTAIMGNALAARRFLDAVPPNLEEIRQILHDVVMDAERASEVTHAVRDMLRKDASEHVLIEVNEVVRETTSLVTSEAAARGVSVRLALAPSLPTARARPVQIRQVLLNLMMNGLEAVTERRLAGGGDVIVSTRLRDDADVQVSVADTGCGLPAGPEDQIFEPLFTTKPAGMGMGLPIARAIVEAHGGAIWAEKAHAGGTIVHFTLPDHRVRQPGQSTDVAAASRLTAEEARSKWIRDFTISS